MSFKCNGCGKDNAPVLSFDEQHEFNCLSCQVSKATEARSAANVEIERLRAALEQIAKEAIPGTRFYCIARAALNPEKSSSQPGGKSE